MKSKSEIAINELERENDGLKAKIKALEDNNSVLKTLKEEGQREVDRLRKAVEELKYIVESKRDNGRSQEPTHSEITPFLMSMFQQRPKDCEERDSNSQKSQVESLNAQRIELEQLRNELRKHEQVSALLLFLKTIFHLEED